MPKSGIVRTLKSARLQSSNQNNEELTQTLKKRLLRQTLIWLVIGVLGTAALIWSQLV